MTAFAVYYSVHEAVHMFSKPQTRLCSTIVKMNFSGPFFNNDNLKTTPELKQQLSSVITETVDIMLD